MFNQTIIFNELPLLVFTLLFQVSLGVAWITSAVQIRQTNQQKSTQVIFLGAAATSLIAIIIATFHLGSPFHAFWILSRIFTQPLPAEVVLLSLFCLSLFVLWKLQGSKAMLYVSALLGLATLLAMSGIYGKMSGTNPAWSYPHTLLRFLVAALLLGSMKVYGITLFWNHIEDSTKRMLQTYSIFTAGIALLIEFFALPWQLMHLISISVGGYRLLDLVTGYYMQLTSFIVFLFLSIIACGISIWAHQTNKQFPVKVVFLIGVICLWVAFFFERNTFYALRSTRLF